MTPPPFDLGQALTQANALWNAGQADQAERLCQQILGAWPGQTDTHQLLGRMALAYGNIRLAIAHLRQACQAPRAPAIYFSDLAELCRRGGMLLEGEEAARTAVTMDPTLSGAWSNLGILLQELDRQDESRACLERALALRPDDPRTHNNLGNTCKRLGLLALAEQHWLRAISLESNYAEPHSNLANLRTAQGQYDQAEALARHAIALEPRLADAYLNLAGLETARQRYAQALHWLDALLSFAPGYVAGLAARAVVLKELDRTGDALEAGRRAVAAGPNSGEAHHALGQALQAAGQYDAALAAYERAAAQPGSAREQAQIASAALHMELGRKAQATAGFEQALAAFPRSAKALYNLADMRRVTRDDPILPRMLDLLGTDGSALSLDDQMQLRFALGKAFLDLGDSAQAFRHLNEGNRLKRAMFQYDSVQVRAWMASIATTFTRGALAAAAKRRAAPAPGSALPVFVFGMPRSGTSLVEQILASHPAVHGAGELRHLPAAVEQIGGLPASVKTLSAEQLAAMGAEYRAAVTGLARGRALVVDKMPSNFLWAGLIRMILPEARMIHVRRDPADTCLSCYTKLFAKEQLFSYNLPELGQFHRDYQTMMDHWRAVLPASHFLEVEYEAVVDDLEAESRRMLAFLGLPWDEAVLGFHQTQRPVRTASVNQVREPIYRSSAGRWRAHAAELQPLLAALGVAAPV